MERTVEVSKITIPDLWHVAMALKDMGDKEPRFGGAYGMSASEAVLECWHLCHDLKRAIETGEIIKTEN